MLSGTGATEILLSSRSGRTVRDGPSFDSLGNETVRLVAEGQSGLEARSVTDIKVGDRLRVRRTVKGTHVGREISARVEER